MTDNRRTNKQRITGTLEYAGGYQGSPVSTGQLNKQIVLKEQKEDCH